MKETQVKESEKSEMEENVDQPATTETAMDEIHTATTVMILIRYKVN